MENIYYYENDNVKIEVREENSQFNIYINNEFYGGYLNLGEAVEVAESIAHNS